jgi:hypothetical protein
MRPTRVATTTMRPLDEQPVRVRMAMPPGGRRLSLVLVAVMVAVGSALVFAVLWANAGARRPVLAMARTVPAGTVIQAADLAVVRVSADAQLVPLPATQRGQVVGRTAAVDLVAGTLVTQAQLGDAPLLAAGEAVVGLALRGARLPTPRLRTGDWVHVVHTAGIDESSSTGGQAGGGQVLAVARVFGVQPPDPSGTVVVSVRVAEQAASMIADAAAVDRVSLVLVPAR